MSTSPLRSNLTETRAQRVSVTENALVVELVDGRTIIVPLTWYPRLAHGSPAERENWRLIGEGERIHWPDLASMRQKITPRVPRLSPTA